MGPETDLPDDDFDVGYAAYGSPQKPPLDHAGQPGMSANGGMFFGPGPPIQTSKAQADAEANGTMYKSHARAEVSNKGSTKFGSFVRKM